MATAKEKLIASAQKLVDKGAFEKAIKEYLRVVQEDDSDVRIWLKIGDLYKQIGKKAEAVETYQRVAGFYSDQGFYLKSVAVYKQILKLDPRLVDVNQRLAELYKQLGLLSDAIHQYEQVAGFFHREGKVKEALAAMKQIVELDPETVAARIKLAEMYSRENMPREAIDEFTRAAEQLKDQGRVEEYMKVAERLLFHSPENRPVTKELARLYIDKNDPRRALPKLQVLFKADPRDLDVLRLLARAFEGLEQRPKAVSVYKELARILAETGDQRGAQDVFRQILAIQPDDADAEAALRGQKIAPPPLRPPTVAPAPPPPRATTLPSAGSLRPHATGAERALDSGGYRAVAAPAARPANVPPPEDEAPDERGAGDVVSEEIAKILSETDVYIKYNLHAKAIEHVQRVFERVPRHVGAREKLKALYVATGKKDEAINELWTLSESVEPGRARRYIHEIYELDPSNARAAKMLGEQIRSAHAVAAPVVAEPDDFGVAPPQDFGLPSARKGRALELDDDLEALDDIDVDEELLDDVGVEVSGTDLGDALEQLSDDDLSADSSRIEVASTAHSLDPLADDDDLIPVVIDAPSSRVASIPVASGDEDRFSLDSQDDLAVEDPSNTFTSGPDVETRFGDRSPSLAETTFGTHEPSFADEAEGTAQMNIDELSSFDDPSVVPAPVSSPGPHATDEMAAVAVASEWEAISSASIAPVPPRESDSALRRVPPTEPPRSDSSLEDDLDESEFFMQQSLYEEARSMLDSLLERYPNHPLVLAKITELDQYEHGAAPPVEDAPVEPLPSVNALSAQLPTELPGSGQVQSVVTDMASGERIEVTRRGVIERGVSAEDFETHYDLGIAYKEMGLIDDAIAEFKICMKDLAREVQCQLMIGLCYIEKQMFTEAINQFKKGLYIEGITDSEALTLYYELGQAYEKIGDPREALYYYDKVQKRDPKFRDLARRIRSLRGDEPAAEARASSPDDFDAAFDSLLDEG